MLTRSKIVAGAMLAFVAMTQVAHAHITVQPNEAPAGAFFRFVVRVPNERDVPTTMVRVEFPENLIFASFQPKEGWDRAVRMKQLDEPIEAFGAEVDTVVGSVTWSGGSIDEGEFEEFGFSVRVPEEEEELEFRAFQTYQGGEVVEWTGPADGDTPAARVVVYDLSSVAEEGTGQLGVLHDTSTQVRALSARIDELEQMTGATDEVDDDPDTAVIFGALGIALGAIALAVALFARRTT